MEAGDASPVDVGLQVQPKTQGFAQLVPPVGDDQIGEAVSVQVICRDSAGPIGGKLRVVAETISGRSAPVDVRHPGPAGSCA